MFKNYLKVAWVSLLKNKTFSIINILGLAMGMSLCLLVITILKDQYSFDQFHPKSNLIYRINTQAIRKSGGTEDYASSPYILGQYVKEHFPYIEKTVPLVRNLNGDIKANEKVLSVNGLMSSPDFFDVFGFSLKSGNKKSALAEPFSIILTEKTAKNFYGNEDPVGQSLKFNGIGDFRITGVIKNPPGKTHLEFDVLGSVSTLASLPPAQSPGFGFDPNDWRDYYMNYTYVRLRSREMKPELEKQLGIIAREQYAGMSLESRDKGYRFYLQPLNEITPGPLLSNNMGRALPMPMLWFLSGLALVVIVSAGFNYNSLSLAKSLSRSKEIAIRKASGALRRQLIFQFLFEAVLTALLALGIAYLLYSVVLKPGFRQLNLINTMDITLRETLPLMLFFVLFSVLVGLISGIFPALHLSRINPVKALKEESSRSIFPKLGFRRVLLVIQFTAALIFVVTLTNMYRQIHFMLSADYGFRPGQIMNIDMQGNNFKILKEEFQKIKGVNNVAGISHPMGTWRDRNVDVRVQKKDEPFPIRDYSVDNEYIDLVHLEFLAGKGFDRNLPEDRELQAVVNEKFLSHFKLGTPAEAIGKTIIVGDSLQLSITGVVKDFHFKPLTYRLEPLLLRYNPSDLSVMNVQLAGDDKVNTVAQLERTWKKLDPNHAFSASFYADQIKDTYESFSEIGMIVSVVTLMAVVVACLGLLGLVLFSVRKQVKEIGIRKVLGASVKQIVIYLSRNFLKLLLISSLIGLPLGILLTQSIFGEFAFRVNPALGYLSGFLILTAIALLTIGIKVIQAAMANPVKSLRTE